MPIEAYVFPALTASGRQTPPQSLEEMPIFPPEDFTSIRLPQPRLVGAPGIQDGSFREIWDAARAS